ncbi:trypsin-like peptidase domain-containing protein [Caulobacter rhizosphaerae]|uniref:trypsin-like peptidase domain-containing protein n=1 Tax=Caulobacter rhizosphaerae TaxID=2010972 RepID=UPI0013D4A3FA|nr:trypsin-like peptidase domain-containing protein [Caulobacter rhizosphaerae]GGL35593.1 hypothetical protein GCM10010983_35740 [Caulobacter rhizosphaerae]
MNILNLPRPLARTSLTGSDLQEIHEALVRSYEPEALALRVLFKWGIRLDWEMDVTQGGRRAIYGRLLKWTEEQGRTRDLLALAWTGASGNDFLLAAASRLLTDLPALQGLYDPPLGAQAPTLPKSELEAVVSERSRLQDYGEFLSRVTALGSGICNVETPGGGSGTGFLVGRRHVLTNHHVVKLAIANRPLGEQIKCRFDYHRQADGGVSSGLGVGLAADWLGGFSPHAQSDETGMGEPSAGQLDYALLRLADAMPDDRPAFGLPIKPSVVAPGDVALIAQHPGGDPLSVAYGVITEFPATGLRYRYNVTTERGSSGAPVLSADLDLIGLHHAADPTNSPRFNQAIPLFLVARDLASRHDLDAL